MTGKQILKWVLASIFQLVSGLTTYLGLFKTFLPDPVGAGLLAAAINISLLVCWHKHSKNRKKSHNASTGVANAGTAGNAAGTSPGNAGTNAANAGTNSGNGDNTANTDASYSADDGYVEKTMLAYCSGIVLLTLSATLSTLGMYAYLGHQLGAETDSMTELNNVFRQTKAVLDKVKDAASKKLASQEADLAKKITSASKRRSAARTSKKWTAADYEVGQIDQKIKTVHDQANSLRETIPSSDESLSLQQRVTATQVQIESLISKYNLARDTVLTPDDKVLLTYDRPLKLTLYEQFVSDLKGGKFLAVLSIAFGVAPDLLGILMVRLSERRRKLRLVIRDGKRSFVETWTEIWSNDDLNAEPVFEVVVINEISERLLKTEITLDISAVSEQGIREFFPLIIKSLWEHYKTKYAIPNLPVDWKETLMKGEPLELMAVEV